MAKITPTEEVKVLKVVEDIQRSDTQAIRVLIVETRGKKKIAIQKFWRKNPSDSWMPGKGFHMEFEEAQLITAGIEQALEEIE